MVKILPRKKKLIFTIKLVKIIFRTHKTDSLEFIIEFIKVQK